MRRIIGLASLLGVVALVFPSGTANAEIVECTPHPEYSYDDCSNGYCGSVTVGAVHCSSSPGGDGGVGLSWLDVGAVNQQLGDMAMAALTGLFGGGEAMDVSSGSRPAHPRGGDPVDGDGEFSQQETDVSFPGFGLQYEFTRTYRSGISYVGPLGFGWDHNYNQRILGSSTSNPITPGSPPVALCSSFPIYHSGRMSDVELPNVTFDGTQYTYAPSDTREPYLLTYSASRTNPWILTNVKTGLVSSFDKYGLLNNVVGPTGGQINVLWSSNSTHTKNAVRRVFDTTGKTIWYTYYANSLLRCLSLNDDCSHPLVTFTINATDSTAADFAELTQVRKGDDKSGVSYAYNHQAPSDEHWLASSAITPRCNALCLVNDPKAPCNKDDICGPSSTFCENMNVAGDRFGANCKAFCMSICAPTCAPPQANQSACLSDCDSNCQVMCTPPVLNDVYAGNATQPGYQAMCWDRYNKNLPYCATSSQAECLSVCKSYFAPPANARGVAYAFGQPFVLNHQLTLIKDGLQRVVLRNTYGMDPSKVSFARVIDQQLGDTQHVKFEYHDLVVEKQYPGNLTDPSLNAFLPSVRDPRLDTVDSFQSKKICPCDSAGNCAAPYNDTGSAQQSQKVRYATVMTDVHGVQSVHYYDSGFVLQREVNLANGETANHAYNNGLEVGVEEPSGVRTCSSLDAAGHPLTVTRIPAPGFPGDATPRQSSYMWSGALLGQYIEDTSSSARVGYMRLTDGRPYQINVAVDDTNTESTMITYGGFYPSEVIAPGSVTRYDGYDTAGAAPTTVTSDFNGPAPVTRTITYDPTWGSVTSDGYTGRGSNQTTYDSAGRVASRTVHLQPGDSGMTTTFVYNDAQQPSSIADPNQTTLPIFDTNNAPINVMQWPTQPGDTTIGRRTCNHYDSDGRLLETVHPEGDSTVYSYDASGRVTRIQRGFNPNLEVGNWSAGCALEHSPPAGDPGLQTVETRQYSSTGFLRSFMKDGVTYEVVVDGFGRVIETSNPVGVKARKGYDHRGRVVWEALYQDAYDPVCKKHVPPNCPESIVPPYGYPQFGDGGLISVIEYKYDNLGRVTQTRRWHLEDRTQRITTTVYDDKARTVTVTDGKRTTTTTTDGLGRVVRVVLPDGSVQSTSYTGNGAVGTSTVQTNIGSVVTERDYDGLGLIAAISVNGTQVFSESHDYDGKTLARFTETEGVRTFGYDAFRRSTTNALHSRVKPPLHGISLITAYAWDGDDRVTGITNPAGEGTTYTFDGLGRILRQTDALGRIASFTYESGTGLVDVATSTAGTRSNTYDTGSRLSRSVMHTPGEPSDEVKTFTYDARGNMTTAAISGAPFGIDNTVTIAYDSFGRVSKEMNSYSNMWVSHNYDLYDGWRSTWVGTLPTGTPHTNQVYDSLGRLASVDVRGQRLANFGYGSAGSGGALSVKFPLISETTKLSYDGRGRQTGIDVTGADGKVRVSLHDVIGVDGIIRQRRYSSQNITQPLSDLFLIDGSGRVGAENLGVPGVPLLSGAGDNSSVSSYMQLGANWRVFGTDAVGNVFDVQTPAGNETRTFNALNQVVSDSAASTIGYDSRDNLTKYLTSPSTPALTFDGDKHVVSADSSAGNVVRIAYDALGRRIAENENGTITYLLWDGSQIVGHSIGVAGPYLDVPGEEHDTYLAYETAAAGGGGTGHGPIVYLHHRPDKSLLATTNRAGTISTYAYSTFGELRTYGLVDAAPAVGKRFLYQGMLYDRWSGSYSMRAREYHTGLGRFLSTDPMGLMGGTNLYGFAGGNPLLFRDPSGLSPSNWQSFKTGFAQGVSNAEQWIWDGNMELERANEENSAAIAALPLEVAKLVGMNETDVNAIAAFLGVNNYGALAAAAEEDSASTALAKSWQEHEAMVVDRLQELNPDATIGEQVTLDVTHNATGAEETIRVDALPPTDNGTYQLVDAKYSSVKDLTTANLQSTFTESQQNVYRWVANGDDVTAVPRGGNAAAAGLNPGVPICLEPSVQVHVNGPSGIVVRNYTPSEP